MELVYAYFFCLDVLRFRYNRAVGLSDKIGCRITSLSRVGSFSLKLIEGLKKKKAATTSAITPARIKRVVNVLFLIFSITDISIIDK